MSNALVHHKTALPAARNARPTSRLGEDIRGPWRFALAVIILLFGVGGALAAVSQISGAVIASGAVTPASSRQTVQHLEGGIVRRIQVKDGDRVEPGQPLLELEDLPGQADIAVLLSELRATATQLARIAADRDGKQSIDFEDPELADRDNQEVRNLIEAEEKQFAARRNNDEIRSAILKERMVQGQRQIEGFERQLEGVRAQQSFIREELETVRDIVEQGLERRPRLLQLQRTEAAAVAQEGALMSGIAEVQASISEIRLQIAAQRLARLEELDTQLEQARTRRRELEEALRKARDKVVRSVIAAPTSGRVFNLKFKTIGGVVRPGEPILEIVPDEEDLVIEARLRATDIDEVKLNQEAHIIFPTFPQRHMQRVPGTVMAIGADASADERTGAPYYQLKVRIDRETLRQIAPSASLEPGMPAEVYIATGERTVIDYLTQPMRLALHRSMREQ
jgi:HlyD family type I secretion membrane fusion protein